jgi:hypothetical protein
METGCSKFARVTVLLGALAVFTALQGCDTPAKEPEKKEAKPATTQDVGKLSARMEVLEQKPLGDDQLQAAKMHHDAAKMQLEAAKLQHSAAGARSAQPLPEVQPKDAFKDIPYDPPSRPRESSKYLDSIPPLSKHRYHDTLQSSKLGAPPAAVEAKWNADPKPYKPPPHAAIRAAVEPKPIRPAQTASYSARKEKRVAGDGSHYTSVQVSAPAGASMASDVTDNMGGNVDAKQYNYNQAAEGALTAVQSGPPHKEHDVQVVKSW